MIDNISLLNSAQNASIQNTRNVQRVREDSANNLATGRRVNQVSDDPSDYYDAKAYNDRIAQLAEERDQIALDQYYDQVAQDTLDDIERYADQLRATALEGRTTESLADRQALSEQFNQISSQIDALVQDASFLGAQTLDGKSASSLGIGDASTDYNDFATLTDINNAVNDITDAVDSLRSDSAGFATDQAILNIRDDYSQNLSDTYQAAVDNRVNADLNEEAAIQLAAQIRDDLGTQGQRVLAQSESAVLDLF